MARSPAASSLAKDSGDDVHFAEVVRRDEGNEGTVCLSGPLAHEIDGEGSTFENGGLPEWLSDKLLEFESDFERKEEQNKHPANKSINRSASQPGNQTTMDLHWNHRHDKQRATRAQPKTSTLSRNTQTKRMPECLITSYCDKFNPTRE